MKNMQCKEHLNREHFGLAGTTKVRWHKKTAQTIIRTVSRSTSNILGFLMNSGGCTRLFGADGTSTVSFNEDKSQQQRCTHDILEGKNWVVIWDLDLKKEKRAAAVCPFTTRCTLFWLQPQQLFALEHYDKKCRKVCETYAMTSSPIRRYKSAQVNEDVVPFSWQSVENSNAQEMLSKTPTPVFGDEALLWFNQAFAVYKRQSFHPDTILTPSTNSSVKVTTSYHTTANSYFILPKPFSREKRRLWKNALFLMRN